MSMTQLILGICGAVGPVVLGLLILAVKVGGWSARINRNERDIGAIFGKLDDIHRFVKNGRP